MQANVFKSFVNPSQQMIKPEECCGTPGFVAKLNRSGYSLETCCLQLKFGGGQSCGTEP